MPNVALFNIAGEEIGKVKLSDEIFGHEVNESVLHTVVTAYLANQRQGTQSALTRAEVSGGGIKPWRQKGTGQARQGSTRSPQWRHGGIVFAPKPRDYRLKLNKKVKRLAMKSVLSDKAQGENLVVFDALNIAEAKTKEMVKVLGNVEVKNALIVLPAKDETVERAARNISGIDTALVGTMNPYEILKHKTLIFTVEALELVEEVYN